jgi:uncharacterized protein YoxC
MYPRCIYTQAMQEELQAQEIQLRTAEQALKEALEQMAVATAASEQLQAQCEQLEEQVDEKNTALQQMQAKYVGMSCTSVECSRVCIAQHCNVCVTKRRKGETAVWPVCLSRRQKQ